MFVATRHPSSAFLLCRIVRFFVRQHNMPKGIVLLGMLRDFVGTLHDWSFVVDELVFLFERCALSLVLEVFNHDGKFRVRLQSVSFIKTHVLDSNFHKLYAV